MNTPKLIAALEAVTAALREQEQFANKTATIHYSERDKLRKKVTAAEKAVAAFAESDGK